MDIISPATIVESVRSDRGKVGTLLSGSAGESAIHASQTHDNSDRMWTAYYASKAGFRSFNSTVHLSRVLYHGRLFARRVMQLGGSARSYLEIGVGTGETLRRVRAATRADCVGVDKTAYACGLAHTNATGCRIVAADGLSLPFPDGSFDVVYSLGLLEHFGLVDQKPLLREHARVARKAVVLHLPADVPHMRMVMWFNRLVWNRSGVWADEELFTPSLFRRKFPGLPFRSRFDLAAGAMTYWFVLSPGDVLESVP